tara:strand:+ start:2569 stop:3141 length:573 start_codon:yes stop_codon:yes gene_type:complete
MGKTDVVPKQMLNKSYTYILPMLSTKIEIVKQNLVNAFIGCDEFPAYDNHIFLLYRYRGDVNFIEYEDYLENTILFKAKYDPDKYHVIFIFDVPKEHQKDYNLFKEGKYSKLSHAYKLLIFKFHKIIDENHKVGKVLFKHPDLRLEIEDRLNTALPDNSELSSVPDLEIEIYTEKMKIKNVLIPPENPFD